MNTRPYMITGACTTLLILSAAADGWGQLVRVERPAAREMTVDDLEASVRLQLYSHPATARRDIDVRVRRERLELRGTVGSAGEREAAEQLARLVAGDLEVVNRLRVAELREPHVDSRSGTAAREEMAEAFLDLLHEEFSRDALEALTLSAYPVALASSEPVPAPPTEADTAPPLIGWVVVLQGTVPTVEDQLAMSEVLVSGRLAAAAVVNRTFTLSERRRSSGRAVRIRGLLFRLDVERDRGGVDVGVGTRFFPPLIRVRSAGRRDRREDRRISNRFSEAVEGDPVLADVPMRHSVHRGIITLQGNLGGAERMRAVRLATRTRDAHGVIDRTSHVDGGEPYHDLRDLEAYLAHRLGEHAATMDVDIERRGREGSIEVALAVPTAFHADLAAAVIAHDPPLAELPLELEIRTAAAPDERVPSPDQ